MVILTVILLLNIVSCGNNNGIGTENEIIEENQLGLKPATYDFFKTIVDVSMAPVEMDVE